MKCIKRKKENKQNNNYVDHNIFSRVGSANNFLRKSHGKYCNNEMEKETMRNNQFR